MGELGPLRPLDPTLPRQTTTHKEVKPDAKTLLMDRVIQETIIMALFLQMFIRKTKTQ